MAVFFITAPASAYPWMIRHDYTGCGMCHVDPSGAGLLTEYGRAQGDLLLRTRYGGEKSAEEAEEPSPTAGFLWGAVTPPEWLYLSGSFRFLGLLAITPSAPAGDEVTGRPIPMQSDLRAGIKAGVFRAVGSIGYQYRGAPPAQITHRDLHNVVSREHWLGVSLLDDRLLLRAGRMNLPFGIRSVEHTMWTRSATRTDINVGQQHGVAASWTGESIRGEVMGILGNYQLGPDAYRERGYSGTFEWSPAAKYVIGINSLMTTALLDVNTRVTTLRQAHGAHFRGSPWKPLVLSAEVDALLRSPARQDMQVGFTGMVQADFEVKQGVHTMGTFEMLQDGSAGAPPSIGGWLSVWWFFAPHADFRFDGIARNIASATDSTFSTTLLAQLHVYL